MKNLFFLLFIFIFSILNLIFLWNINTFIIFTISIFLLISVTISIYRASVGLHYRSAYYYLHLIFSYPITFILLFASFYKSSFAMFSATINTHWYDPLYFSIVTWTTLGYGDYQPCNFDTKFIASLEGFIGYLFSGIIIVMIFNLIKLLDKINNG